MHGMVFRLRGYLTQIESGYFEVIESVASILRRSMQIVRYQACSFYLFFLVQVLR